MVSKPSYDPDALASHDRQDLPYFDSPVSGSRRTDTVFRFAARKTAEAAPVDIPDPVPPWVSNPLVPIPITPALVALAKTSMFTTSVLSMIDGERSVVDVARELGAAWKADPGRLQDDAPDGSTLPRRSSSSSLSDAIRSSTPSLRQFRPSFATRATRLTTSRSPTA